jgi:FkbM family methyltransferase
MDEPKDIRSILGEASQFYKGSLQNFRFINEVVMFNKISSQTYDLKFIGNLKIYYRKGTCDEVILKDEYQDSRFFIPEYEPKEDHIILDIGAHIGVFSLLAAEKAPKGKVYSIEADEENYRCLQTNIESNHLSNISAYLIALTDYRGTGKLYAAKESWAHSLCEPVSEVWKTVKTDTLANFMTENKIHHVDYMKINVEGAEYSILFSTPERAMKRIKLMLVEFHPSKNQNEHDLTRYLEQCGFSTKTNWSAEEKGKGWIVARLET